MAVPGMAASMAGLWCSAVTARLAGPCCSIPPPPRSATAAAQDSHVVISPDRGDGARMSWVQVSDNVVDPGDGRQGLSVSFYDYRATAVDFVFQ